MLAMILEGSLFVVVPVLVAALVTGIAAAARRAGVQIPRVMREGPWHSDV